MSMQQYYLFDTYYDSLIRAPIDISKNNIEPKGKFPYSVSIAGVPPPHSSVSQYIRHL